MPTLLLPKKATSGNGEDGKERKYAALKRISGGLLWKNEAAYLSCCPLGGVEMVYEFKVAEVILRSVSAAGLASGGDGGSSLGTVLYAVVTLHLKLSIEG